MERTGGPHHRQTQAATGRARSSGWGTLYRRWQLVRMRYEEETLRYVIHIILADFTARPSDAVNDDKN
jgi:hypothetical protein